MKKQILFMAITLASTVSLAAPKITCLATYLSKNLETNEQIRKSEKFILEMDTGANSKYSAELEGKMFYLDLDKSVNDYIMTIVTGPDYTQGVISKARPNSDGRLTLSEVNGHTVYRMDCLVK
jgi:hypothetical protein